MKVILGWKQFNENFELPEIEETVNTTIEETIEETEEFDFDFDTLSVEEKKALPAGLKAYLDKKGGKKSKKEDKEDEKDEKKDGKKPKFWEKKKK